MKRPGRVSALAALVVLIAFGVVLALSTQSSPNTGKGRLAGKPAPEFAITTLDGDDVSLDDLRNKTVLVNFWNEWCIPCQKEEPALAAFYDRHRDDADFAMVGILRDSLASDAELRNYVEGAGIEWIVGRDPKSKAALAYGTTGQPESFMIAPDGTVVAEQFSTATLEDLETMLRAARGTL